MLKDETITAPATPPGKGGVGIVRVSGEGVKAIAKEVLGFVPKARQALLLNFYAEKAAILDEGIAIFFPGPHSFTGEDVLELQAHGGPVVLDKILSRILSLGVRMAQPGEFCQRAFLNGKIDLTQAEAIADLINASSAKAANSAVRSLQGEFSKRVSVLNKKIIDLRTYVEAAIDFPEEEINFISEGNIDKKLEGLLQDLEAVLITAEQGRILQEGISVVIAGKPNAGKSSLLNYLCGHDSAIVTEIPGTTRDVLREFIQIDGVPLHIVDTAGIQTTADMIEKEGIRRAKEEIKKADLVLLMLDNTDRSIQKIPTYINKEKLLVLRNKIDLTKKKAKIETQKGVEVLYLSAKTGEGVCLLEERLKEIAGLDKNIEGEFIARRRHLDALKKAKEFLLIAQHNLNNAELLAEELKQSHNYLGQITGEFYTDDLLSSIFSQFCVGK